MRFVLVRVACLLAAATLVVSCSPGAQAKSATVSVQREGLELTVSFSATPDSAVADVVLHNGRSVSVALVPDQCGRVTEALLVRTAFEPEGRTWEGSVQAAKELILANQRSYQSPDRFHPRRPGSVSQDVPTCQRPATSITLAAGEDIAERWQLPFVFAYGLDAVGSQATKVRVEAVEAKPDGSLEYLDIAPTGSADEARAGRNVRIELATSELIDHAAASDDGRLSQGQIYDRLVENDQLREWIAAQPVDSWRLGTLQPIQGTAARLADLSVRLRLVSTSFEAAAIAEASAYGADVTVSLPGEGERTRVFATLPGTLPPGITLIEEPDGYSLADDLVVGSVELPTGRLMVGEYLSDDELLPVTIRPGSYPVVATLARYEDGAWQDVAFATMVLSAQPTVRWQEAHAFPVDGGSTTFTSAETADLMSSLLDADLAGADSGQGASLDLLDRIFDSREAHDGLATEFTVAPGRNLVELASGAGDGLYPVFIGYDAAGQPTRVVSDFLLLHLDWPGPG